LLLRDLAVPCLAFGFLLASCSAGSGRDDDDDAGRGGEDDGGSGGKGGGAGAVGGGAGTGGTGGSGGSTTPPLAAGPRPFPQNRASGACTITTVPNASDSVRSVYEYWKMRFVVPAGNSLRVVRDTNGNDTVSEGIAYGMLAAVYMNDRPAFDGFWAYAMQHKDSHGFMHWHINADGTVASDGMGSALDADEDMAWALLMASAQWQSGAYLDEGKRLINGIVTFMTDGEGMLLPGDGWGNTDRTFPDYFSPGYYRVFGEVTNSTTNWNTIIDRNYAILEAVSGMYGLVPDSTTRTYQHMGAYGYDACRTPWRIGMDYCFSGDPRAKAYLDKIAPFFVSQGNILNIGDGYSLTGQKTGGSANMAFIGPAGVAGMAGWPQLLNDAFSFGATGTGGTTPYYQQTLRLITMLMMSGNFLDYSKSP
jgi:endo-1,4-beta-D-glucanase Y